MSDFDRKAVTDLAKGIINPAQERVTSGRGPGGDFTVPQEGNAHRPPLRTGRCLGCLGELPRNRGYLCYTCEPPEQAQRAVEPTGTDDKVEVYGATESPASTERIRCSCGWEVASHSMNICEKLYHAHLNRCMDAYRDERPPRHQQKEADAGDR